MQIPKYDFFGLDVSVFTKEELINSIDHTIRKEKQLLIYGYSIWSFYKAEIESEYYHYSIQSDVLVTDGTPFYYLAKLHGLPLKVNLSIPELVYNILVMSESHNYDIFLFGASKVNNEKAIEKLKNNKGTGRIGGLHGYINKSGFNAVITEINQFNPHILLIGLPTPIKEKYGVLLKKYTNANIIIPCGGMIDILSGARKTVPKNYKRLGLASFYRMLKYPLAFFSESMKTYLYFIIKFLPRFVYHSIIKRDSSYSIIKNQS